MVRKRVDDDVKKGTGPEKKMDWREKPAKDERRIEDDKTKDR